MTGPREICRMLAALVGASVGWKYDFIEELEEPCSRAARPAERHRAILHAAPDTRPWNGEPFRHIVVLSVGTGPTPDAAADECLDLFFFCLPRLGAQYRVASSREEVEFKYAVLEEAQR